jgi:hypothetical protein
MKAHSAHQGEVNMSYRVGDSVLVRCSVQNGPFPDERLVTVETAEGRISGFVRQANLEPDPADSEHAFLRGTVVAATDDSVTVKLFGSFFTTATGVALVAKNNLRRVAA